jgi:hypothetical protein
MEWGMEEDMEEAAMVEDGVVHLVEDMVDMEALEVDREGAGNGRKTESYETE